MTARKMRVCGRSLPVIARKAFPWARCMSSRAVLFLSSVPNEYAVMRKMNSSRHPGTSIVLRYML